MKRRTFLAVLGAAILASSDVNAQGGPPRAPAQRPQWGAAAEKEFRLGRGMGPALMTEEEWKEHQEKMRTLSPEQREAYRREVHEKMAARAKEKGLEMPAASPRGPRSKP